MWITNSAALAFSDLVIISFSTLNSNTALSADGFYAIIKSILTNYVILYQLLPPLPTVAGPIAKSGLIACLGRLTLAESGAQIAESFGS
jgi:hypothetical protein